MASFIDPAVLPFVGAFLLTFAIVFGALSYAKVLGDQKKVNGAIALAFAIFAAIYEPFVTALQQVLPIAAALVVLLFFILLLKKVFTGKEGEKTDYVPITISLALGLLVLGALWDEIGIDLPGLNADNVLWLIAIVVLILIFFTAYKYGKE